MTDRHLIRVGLAVPVADTFDYIWPEEHLPPIGVRVRVPFGRRERIGLVLGHPQSSLVADEKLKVAIEQLDAAPLLDAPLLDCLLWAAAYYHHPLGDAVNQALPSLLRRGRPLDGPRERGFSLTVGGSRVQPDLLAARAPRQARALEYLAARDVATASELRALGIGTDVLARLREKSWIAARELPPDTPEPASTASSGTESGTAPRLNAHQQAAIDIVQAQPPGFGSFLLFGVTGSGKTEVYMQLMQRNLRADRQSLLLVPEIALTPQLVGRLEARFGKQLAVLHSGLGDQERLAAWRRARRGAAKLVVGTRSAVFAPMPGLGLIIVDEEHDASFKQQTGFRYSARDLAIVRAQKLGITVVLGSATPSLESYHNAKSGKYVLLELPERVGGGGSPRYRTIDLNRHATRHALSTPLLSLIETHLAKDRQIILFLNRRGFAPTLFCPTCKLTEDCDRCDARLTVHARDGRLRCHHCGRESPLEWRCPVCGTERVGVGAGTQRINDALEALLPGREIARLDRDATAKKGALEAVLDRFASGRAKILVGTQMLAKGHDFPNVTLVGVLNADQGLFGTDFRSTEHLAQTIVQVAGRAGRRDETGEVVIQTHYPGHPLLSCLIEQGYRAFADLALAEREASGWPPFSHVAVVRAESRERRQAFEFLYRVRAIAQTSEVTMLGPAPNAMERHSGRYRAQLVLQSKARASLHALLGRIAATFRAEPAARKLRWSIDVDPIEV